MAEKTGTGASTDAGTGKNSILDGINEVGGFSTNDIVAMKNAGLEPSDETDRATYLAMRTASNTPVASNKVAMDIVGLSRKAGAEGYAITPGIRKIQKHGR